MIKKTVDNSGAIILKDGENTLFKLITELDREERNVKISLEGILRTDVQVYLGTELQFYAAANLKGVEVDCGKLTAVSPGCFGVLLDLKIKMAEKNAAAVFINKPECLVNMEKLMGKKL